MAFSAGCHADGQTLLVLSRFAAGDADIRPSSRPGMTVGVSVRLVRLHQAAIDEVLKTLAETLLIVTNHHLSSSRCSVRGVVSGGQEVIPGHRLWGGVLSCAGSQSRRPCVLRNTSCVTIKHSHRHSSGRCLSSVDW